MRTFYLSIGTNVSSGALILSFFDIDQTNLCGDTDEHRHGVFQRTHRQQMVIETKAKHKTAHLFLMRHCIKHPTAMCSMICKWRRVDQKEARPQQIVMAFEVVQDVMNASTLRPFI